MAGEKKIHISNGARLYEEALPLVDDKEQFIMIVDEEFEGEIPYKYVTYTRK